MRTKMNAASPEVELTRILEAMEQELIDASDEEIMEAAADLGMDPKMKGSAAFAGIKFPVKPQLSDFFEFEVCKNARVATGPIAGAAPRTPKRTVRQVGRVEISTEGKVSREK